MLKQMIVAIMIAAPVQFAWAAGSDRASATVEWSREARSTVVLEDVAWRCSGNDCRGPLQSSGRQAIARYCKLLARYGEVTSFRTAAGPLPAEALKRCNGANPKSLDARRHGPAGEAG